MELRKRALAALITSDIAEKAAAVQTLQRENSNLPIDTQAELTAPAGLPGHPARPELVPPSQVPRRSPATAQGLATLLHAVCHIEFNAINLALDAVWRFAHMPEAYYRDWLRVAAEEAYHFDLLHTQLQSMGHEYGDFAAHSGLWDMCERTADDLTARMALVPRTLEARGLDATPLMQQRLRQVASVQARQMADRLDIILRDEVGHVAIGNHWYRWLCERDGLDPLAHYAALTQRYRATPLKPPFNLAARTAAGFTAAELAYLRGDELR